jgi:hypothetical protein
MDETGLAHVFHSQRERRPYAAAGVRSTQQQVVVVHDVCWLRKRDEPIRKGDLSRIQPAHGLTVM